MTAAAADGSGTARHRVVIIGAGFGGLSAVRALRMAPVEVTVVDRTNHHLFQPLLYQVATGVLLSPASTRTVSTSNRTTTRPGASRRTRRSGRPVYRHRPSAESWPSKARPRSCRPRVGTAGCTARPSRGLRRGRSDAAESPAGGWPRWRCVGHSCRSHDRPPPWRRHRAALVSLSRPGHDGHDRPVSARLSPSARCASPGSRRLAAVAGGASPS